MNRRSNSFGFIDNLYKVRILLLKFETDLKKIINTSEILPRYQTTLWSATLWKLFRRASWMLILLVNPRRKKPLRAHSRIHFQFDPRSRYYTLIEPPNQRPILTQISPPSSTIRRSPSLPSQRRRQSQRRLIQSIDIAG